MPRKPIIRSNEHFYHVTGRSNNKENFYISQDQTWEIMMRKLSLLQKEFDLHISAFVLMSNHFHLLIMTPTESIDRIMYFFMKDVTKTMQKRSGRINRIFGGRYKGCLIEDNKYLMNVYKYIYRNPIAANIIKNAEDYPYSTLNQTDKVIIEPIMPMNLAVSKSTELIWINENFSSKESESLKWGLSRSVFKYKSEKSTGRKIAPRSDRGLF